MSCLCDTTVDYCVTKGTNFEASVAFTSGAIEIIETPDDYEGVMVFREFQDDGAEVYLTLRSDVAPVDPDVPASLTFTATPTQTAGLPDWDHVAYCNIELRSGGSVQRLFNAKVAVNE